MYASMIKLAENGRKGFRALCAIYKLLSTSCGDVPTPITITYKLVRYATRNWYRETRMRMNTCEMKEGCAASHQFSYSQKGAVGVAVISAIFGRSDVKEAAKELRDAVERAL